MMKFPADYVIKAHHGSKMAYKTFRDHFDEAKKKAAEKLGVNLNCTFHDIKAKSISDYEGDLRDKQFFSGHKTESQVAVYDRKVKKTPSLDLPVIKK